MGIRGLRLRLLKEAIDEVIAGCGLRTGLAVHVIHRYARGLQQIRWRDALQRTRQGPRSPEVPVILLQHAPLRERPPRQDGLAAPIVMAGAYRREQVERGGQDLGAPEFACEVDRAHRL